MDTKTQRNSREEVAGKAQEGNLKRDGKEGLQEKQQALPTSPASPSSASSSPSHEFSFTISLHSASAPVLPDNAKTPPCSFAIDLSPADDIFFHGHLLPLHLLSHLHVSPRSSTNSLDGSTLPVKELLDDQRPGKSSNNCSTSNGNSGSSSSTINKCSRHRSKPKSFSLFGWRKGCEVKEKEEGQEKAEVRRQSGTEKELRGTIGEYSAPASMRASPANGGLLLATTTLPSSTSDSTMEEFQAAIQAAIAHCKNSITAEDR
ncbi:MEMBRANE-ASSOCIATED KINASE REGULATOR 4-RELATED [Salix koriyanagi]|uniref:MEMBRANE-ASSOCIATED KINASE REGULATOR 4-RELATED n=1 Tax=Salix koriyanagi TaxID=2511006 RepID=A0A9Q0TDS5_9ROSI|nr:MEMBRANE-ASSOCIATED KINASE REGULATOR 4-RELATED [Salix koriyanagi]